MASYDVPGFVARFALEMDEDMTTGCWVWRRPRADDGYGDGEGGVRAHVLAWEAAHPGERRGPQDVVMHLCRRRACCNPRHLALGSKADNADHDVAAGAHAQARKTHCPRGHEYTPENTWRRSNGARQCRACRRRGA